MADRLAELLRQRALLQDHVAWLDREIAAASDRPAAALTSSAGKATAPTAPPAPALAPVPLAVSQPAAPAAVANEVAPFADEILDQYRVPTQTLQTDVRKGCLLYFVGAFAVLFAVVAILYLAFRK